MTTVEQSTVQWGTTKIPYLIRRSTSRRTVAVAVEPSGTVVLTAPAKLPVERLDGVVRKKARWIVERVRRRSEVPPAPQHEFVSGESVLYLGRNYRLRVVTSGGAALVRFDRGGLIASIPRDIPSLKRPSAVRQALERWMRQRATDRLPERVDLWAKKLGVTVRGVLVREQRQRWASCDALGRLRFNWRIVQAPMSLVDYVVAHELTHRLHKDHTPRFWAALGRVMSDYEQRKERLRVLGPALSW